jgi:hypothetical protein
MVSRYFPVDRKYFSFLFSIPWATKNITLWSVPVSGRHILLLYLYQMKFIVKTKYKNKIMLKTENAKSYKYSTVLHLQAEAKKTIVHCPLSMGKSRRDDDLLTVGFNLRKTDKSIAFLCRAKKQYVEQRNNCPLERQSFPIFISNQININN